MPVKAEPALQVHVPAPDELVLLLGQETQPFASARLKDPASQVRQVASPELA